MSGRSASELPRVEDPEWGVWLVGTSPGADAAIRQRALEAGRSVFDVNAGTARSADDLVAEISREFLVPHEVRGLDALLSVLSDLDWLANEAGYLLVLSGATDLRRDSEDLFRKLVRILPHLCDRWRTRSVPFQIVVRSDRATAEDIKALVLRMYAEFRASEWDSDFAEVPILEIDTGCA